MTHLAHLARPRRRGGPVAFGALGALGVPLSTPGISVAVGATGAFRALGAPGALGALGEWRASRACRTWRAFRTWRTGRAWRMTSRGAPGARPLPPRATGGGAARRGAPPLSGRPQDPPLACVVLAPGPVISPRLRACRRARAPDMASKLDLRHVQSGAALGARQACIFSSC